jgi:hypothetical protein
MDGLKYDRPNRPPNVKTSGFSNQQLRNGIFKVTDFCPNGLVPFFLGTPCLPVGTNGNPSRNAFRGSAFKDVDLGLSKDTKVRERLTIQFRADAFNLLPRLGNLWVTGGRAEGITLRSESKRLWGAKLLEKEKRERLTFPL